MIRIAVIISRIEQLGPVKTVETLVNKLKEFNNLEIKLFYIDKEIDPDVNVEVPTERFDINSFNFRDYDIVHTHGIRPDLIAFRYRKKIRYHISTMHNFIFDDLAYTYNKLVAWVFGNIWIHILKRVDKLICVTDSLKEYYKRWFPEDRLYTIYNSVTVPDNSLVPDEDIIKSVDNFHSKGLKVIGTACVLTQRKGINQVLQTISKAKDYGFIIIGDGKELKNIIRESEHLGITDRCYFSGFRSHASIYFKYFDIFIMPSYSEGFGLSLVEAVQSKVPVVCSDIAVFRELFKTDEVAFFRLDDVESLTDSLQTALINGKDKIDLAYKRYMDNYRADLMAQRYHDLYQSCS